MVLLASCAKPSPAVVHFPVMQVAYVDGAAKYTEVKDFNKTVTESTIPVFVDFWATWCPPCKLSGPFVETLAKEYEGRILILKVDVDDMNTLASSFNVQSIPSFFTIRDGTIQDSVVGYAPSLDDQIRAMIDATLS
jgi:thioredoxin 1